uniref:VPS10 domain-containing protein n=1 Tax=Chromera velia CCMP2878 TaxID=1169474 RepID=A0A0G4F4M6_9ALVE|eukprot:Cvel_2736.t1-p1 / transcript=Cvel_2736.t1 / gene=Cvel_2736 / organism=Chromera_velia_CCMP2878 / gene_product=Vacuolar protein sorting/targeting protein 10, putative / transcript_product=Vacuolar protein sorting/targeting protein 10, putative / location=Cvel_scaffold109:91073-114933(+) / protein_length=1064 / sequence_SO=supercontig / SO=protein_coding / is_pseudo=false
MPPPPYYEVSTWAALRTAWGGGPVRLASQPRRPEPPPPDITPLCHHLHALQGLPHVKADVSGAFFQTEDVCDKKIGIRVPGIRILPDFPDKKPKELMSVSEVSFDSAVEDIQWLGGDHRTVLLKTQKGSLSEGTVPGSNFAPATVTVENVVVNGADKNVVLIQGSKHTHFISEDGARTFRRLKQRAPIHQWQFHPSRSKWALLSTWTETCDAPGAGHKKDTSSSDSAGEEKEQPCNHLLYVTRDAGRTFSFVESYVVQFSWGDPKLSQEERIFYTHHRHKKGDQPRFGGWAKTVDLSYTDNLGKSSTTAVHRGNKFLVSNGYVFVAKLADATKQTVELQVSTDGARSFRTARLPFAHELQEKSYTILDTSEGAVMLHVNHGDHGRSGTGNVYISDAAGFRYSLSLPSNIRSLSGECEFDKVLSMDGVYIANFKDDATQSVSNDNRDGGEMEAVEKEAELEEEETTATNTDLKRMKRKKKAEEVVKTVISFDKGAVWSYLKAPKIDSKGQKTPCYAGGQDADSCWLHLHGITNFHNYAPFYSVENAVGIILGTGNVGGHLRYEPDEINTYLSRDGGVSWVEAHKGAFIYEFGDHGGLIVMADDLRKTNQVVFSWNEGQSWYDFDLGAYPVEVDNIVIEPNASAVEFLLYGTRGDAGVLFHLDFGALGQPACKGIWAADSVSSDYESWTPSTGGTSGCSLGRQVTYTRRKQTSECFNGQDFQRPVFKKNCECSEEDFECEFGFTRKVGSTTCSPEDPDLTAESCATGGYVYTDAYRKVPGDTCEGGWVPPKVSVPCPARSLFSKALLWFFGVVLVGVAVLLCLGLAAGGGGGAGESGESLKGVLGFAGGKGAATKENFSKASRWRAVGGIKGVASTVGQTLGKGLASLKAIIAANSGGGGGSSRFGDIKYSQVGGREMGFGEGVEDFSVGGDAGLDDDDLAAEEHDDAPPLLSYSTGGQGDKGGRGGKESSSGGEGGDSPDVESGQGSRQAAVHHRHQAAPAAVGGSTNGGLMRDGAVAAVPRLTPPPSASSGPSGGEQGSQPLGFRGGADGSGGGKEKDGGYDLL